MWKKRSTIKYAALFFLLFAFLHLAGCEGAVIENPGAINGKGVTNGSFTDNKNGTVSFSFDNSSREKYKVVTQIEGGKMYQYDIPEGKCDLVFPLSQGNGTYKVYLVKNTSGNRYSIVESLNVELNITDELSVFLCSNYIIDWNTENEAIKKAYKLTEGMTEDSDKIEAIYKYMVENFSYDYDKMETVNDEYADKAYVPDIEKIYALKTGICYDVSALFAAMLRSVSVPAKVVTGYSSNTVAYHAWNSIYYSPKKDWKTMDLTYDIQMFANGKKYSMFKNDDYYSNIVYSY